MIVCTSGDITPPDKHSVCPSGDTKQAKETGAPKRLGGGGGHGRGEGHQRGQKLPKRLETRKSGAPGETPAPRSNAKQNKQAKQT
jgi:hypothetical protein